MTTTTKKTTTKLKRTEGILEMITVGGYQPLAGHNRNTIRFAAEKYANLVPGDVVKMTYCDSVDANGAPVDVRATEIVTIASVARGDLKTICQAHYTRNHGLPKTVAQMVETISALYRGETKGEFLAIYFI